MSSHHHTEPTPVAFKSLVGQPVFVELLRAKNVIKADIVSESDPYVIISLRENAQGGCCCSGDAEGALIPNSIEKKWPTVDDEPNPGWFTTVWLAKEAKAGSVLTVKLFDEDATADELLGLIRVPVEKIQLGQIMTLPIPFVGDKNKIQEVQLRFKEAFPNPKKRVIIIRHGESEWNEAQSEMNISQMAARTDHPLTPLGATQALGLAKKVSTALTEGNKPENQTQAVQDLLGTQVIYVSPLCRAVQTAILGLHPLGLKPSWELKKNAREKRNFGGKDSSGTTYGKDLVPFLLTELDQLADKFSKTTSLPDNHPEFPDKNQLATIITKMDATETETKWWTDDREDTQDSGRRISDLFFQQVMWDPRPVVVIVGHSHFFRDLFVHYMSNELREKIKSKQEGYDEYTLEQWFNYKLENCGAAHLEFDFSPILNSWVNGTAASGEALKCIQNVSLILGTKLEK